MFTVLSVIFCIAHNLALQRKSFNDKQYENMHCSKYNLFLMT